MKKSVIILISGLCLFMIVPYFGIRYLSLDGWVVLFMAMILVVNPLFIIVSGAISAKNIKKNWFVPLLLTAFIVISHTFILKLQDIVVFIFYYIAYLVLGYFAMITAGIIIKKQKLIK